MVVRKEHDSNADGEQRRSSNRRRWILFEGQPYDSDHKSVCRQSCREQGDFERLVHCCNGIISILPSTQVRESTGDEFFSGERVRPPGYGKLEHAAF